MCCIILLNLCIRQSFREKQNQRAYTWDTHTEKEENRFILRDSWGRVVNLKFMGLGSISEIWLKVNESKIYRAGQQARNLGRVFCCSLEEDLLTF